MGSNTPDTKTFPLLRDVSMNNLAIGTIWFRDGTSLNSKNDIRLLTADGALTYTYKVDTDTIDLDLTRTQPIGVFHFNDSDQESATNIFISKSNSPPTDGTPIDLTDFYNYIATINNGIPGETKAFVSLSDKTDVSKQLVYKITGISVFPNQ